MSRRLIVTIDRDLCLVLALTYLIIYEFLPVIHVVTPLLLSLVRLFAVLIFYFYVLSTDSSMGLKYIFQLTIVFFINLLAYYNCWCNYESPGAFVIKSMMCWVYMQIGIYIVKYGSKGTKRIIATVLVILVCISSITSIITLQTVPTAVRELGNGSMHIKGMEDLLHRKNTLTWGGLYGTVFLLPYLIIKLKKEKRPMMILCIVIIEACVLKSQITIAILISAFFLLLLFIDPPPKHVVLPMGFGFILASGIIMNYIENILAWLAELFTKFHFEILSLRFSQIHYMVSRKQGLGISGGRFDLYKRSIMTFVHNPISGYKVRDEAMFSHIGLHSQVFDLMASVGIIGSLLLLGVLISLIRTMLIESKKYQLNRYFAYSFLMIVFLNITNPTWYAESIYLSAFVGIVINAQNKDIQTEY